MTEQNETKTAVQEFNDTMKEIQEHQTDAERASAQQASTDGMVQEIQERMELDESTGQDDLRKLGEQPASGVGDFVFTLNAGGYTGTDDRFKHVHGCWLASEHCWTFDQAKQALAIQQQEIVDIRGPLNDWYPAVVHNPTTGRLACALVYRETEQPFFPTEHALKQCSVVGNTSSFFVQALTRDQYHATKKDENGDPALLYRRDEMDAELLCITLERTLFRADRVDQQKERLFRVWKSGTLRALLSSLYAIVDNRWVLDTFSRLIPGGMLSHWRGDADSIYGNVLIPDIIRTERDSAYGGMVSIGNSEIGLRRLFSMPSVFRSICANGCIWDAETGKALNMVHKSKDGLPLDKLAAMISENLNKQIPLLQGMIDKMISAQKLTVGDTPIKNVLAECARKWSWTKKQLTGVNQAWHTESALIGNVTARSLFGIQAAVTRFGQMLDAEQWFSFDLIGGELICMSEQEWDRLVKRADNLDDRTLEKLYGKDAS